MDFAQFFTALKGETFGKLGLDVMVLVSVTVSFSIGLENYFFVAHLKYSYSLLNVCPTVKSNYNYRY